MSAETIDESFVERVLTRVTEGRESSHENIAADLDVTPEEVGRALFVLMSRGKVKQWGPCWFMRVCSDAEWAERPR